MEDNVIRIDAKQKTSAASVYSSNMVAYDRMKKTTTALANSIAEMTTDTSYLAATRAIETLNSRMAEILKSYTAYDLSQSVAAALKEMSKAINYDISREIRESLNAVGREFSAIDMTSEIRKSMESLTKSMMSFTTINTSDAVKNITESIKTMADSIQAEQLRQLQQLDYSKIFSDIMVSSGSFKDAIDTAYQAIKEESSEETGLETDFSSEEEIHEAITEQINNPIGFQERISKWTAQKIAKYFVIWQIISFLWANFAQPYFQEKVGMPVMSYVVSNVKELPQKGAEVICQLKEDIEAVIIENTNYYYKVSFIDENGVQREGYVAKRNLKLIEETVAIEELDNSKESFETNE